MAETPKNSETSKRTKSWWSKNWFYEFLEDHFFWILIGIAGIGMVLAFTVPLWVCSFSKEDSVSTLRQAILASTGGTLAIFTLLETHQKNIREKEKNEQDHIRQVHAERRSRYAKAIEQLADEKAPIRLGGVYTLAKLVDEWLADEKPLPSEKEGRQGRQEGQIIIDSLCAYIRSSFPLAERYDELTLSYEEYQQNRQGNQDLHSPQVIPLPKPKNAKQSREEFVRDKSLFQEEQEVRKTILSEIKNRLNGGNGGKVKREDGKHEIKPGTWSYFKYNFSNAVFFYPVDLKIANFSREIEFRYAKFIDTADFYFTTFFVAIFAGVEFSHDAKFSHAVFKEYTDFSSTTFIGNTLFKHSKYLAKPQFTYKSSGVYTTARFAEGSKNNFSFINNGIETKRHFSRNGVVTIIPKGCVVFDPITQKTIQHYPLFDNENTIIPEIKEKLQMSDWPKKQNWHISV
ncbi:pentapeptide repeat-containing protein [Rothia dentocariosa]|uniref:pentapeptide repeat-containing protein n=1 Tax=Rothia dentocariosa TaxID=2047 RepID=UPI0028EF5BB5|nr:pentapeptide repeat-containing protein [Rothia dentocariosa]